MSIIEVGQASRTNGWLGGENQNQGGKQRETRWLTPRHLTDPLGHFDLDPAGAPGHSIATRTLLLENGDDGLVDEWSGRIWLNPPYGKQLEPFMSRLADHGNGIALVFARTETSWFQEFVWGRATSVMFLKGRVTFLDANRVKAPANAGAPSCLVAYGENNYQAIEDSGLPGCHVHLRYGLPNLAPFVAVEEG